jgi:hypothetical protein
VSGRAEKARRREAPAGATATSAIQLPFTPYAHQRAAHAARGTFRFLVLVWHRRAGKTVFCIIELILAALACRKERPRFGYVAPFLKQGKTIAWEYLKAFTRPIPGCKVNESELSITFSWNNAVIGIFGADHPDNLRGGYFDGIIFDEYGDMKPQTWGEVVRPALSDRKGWAIFIGTPKGISSFSELFFRAQKGFSGWWANLLRWQDTGVIDREEIESAKREMTPNAFSQEYECDWFAAATNVLVPMDRALGATQRDYMVEEYGYAAKVIGVDVARFGDDRSVIARRQGLVAYSMREDPANGHVFRGLDTMELAAQVCRVCDDWKRDDGRSVDAIFVDETGVGAGVVDRLKQLGYRPIGVQFGGKPTKPRFQNKRTEMWWDMAEWMKVASIPNDQSLLTDLTAPTYTYRNAAGRLELESKDDMRERGLKSPDKGDALACTFFAPVLPPELHGVRGGIADRCVTEDS